MDFRLSDDQLTLQAAIRTYCEDNYAFERLPSLADREHRLAAFVQLAGLDVFRIAVPAERGGLGLGVVDAAVVFEVLGEYLAPGPLVWSALAAHFVPELHAGMVGGLDAQSSPTERALVEFGPDLDALLVLRGGQTQLVLPNEVEFTEVQPTDPLTPVAIARDIPFGRVVADGATTAELRLAGVVLSAALLVGIAERGVGAAVAYTSQRYQFGRPVGSFQAIKHLLADSYARVSLARSAMYAAAAVYDDRESGDITRAASAAKLLAADAAIRNARTCIQAHGGMGFTWEMIPHYLLKRAWVLENSFGARAVHSSNMAAALDRELV